MQAILYRFTIVCAALVFLGSSGTGIFRWYQAHQIQQEIADLPRYAEIQEAECARRLAVEGPAVCTYMGPPSLSRLEQDRDEAALHSKVFICIAIIAPLLLFAFFFTMRWILIGPTRK